ncbi:MAG TPA: DUF4011 domain-containing protein [Kofleriaceae bacterium]
MDKQLRVEVEAARELSLAMVENSVPLVAQLSLTNTGATELSNLSVELALLPDYSAKWTAHISAIPAGGTYRLAAVELPLDRDRLVNQLERGRAELRLWVRHEPDIAPLTVESVEVDVLAYNEWSPRTVPQLLAAYVLPNHPAVAELLAAARAPLEKMAGNPALNGYQSGSPARVSAIAQAIYETLGARNITYSEPPASFESIGQKVRTPEQVLHDQVATCLDVSVTIASCLEQAGLHPIVIVVSGHAYPGVWLDGYYGPDGYFDDGAQLRKLVAVDRLLVFDSSSAVTRPAIPFAEAKRRATRSLTTDPFVFAVDIHGSRKLHFRPLPARVVGAYTAAPEAVPTPLGPDSRSGSRQVPPEGSGKLKTSVRTKHPRIEAWKQSLLDTTLRNRLINYRDVAETLHLMTVDIGLVEDALATGQELVLKPKPALLGGDDPRSKKLLDARVSDDAMLTFLRERLSHGELCCDATPEKTTSKLTTIYRAAREAIEETGSNPLCLAIGMLDWYESESSDKPRRAPILLVPVTLVRNARASTFTLQASGEDTRLNVTLFEKLRIEHGITVPELAELPTDDAGVDVAAVLRVAREAVMNLPRWEVHDELHLGLFSFAKFQLWADLDQNADLLLKSAVLGHIIDGRGETYPNAGPFPEPGELDTRYSPKDLLCPLDADASQLAAVAAAAAGRTFVLQGPPGTGKSQTITNLIAHAIALGKRVLFVAEKAAALEVVQRRLTAIGLAPYVLELHSHKSGKLQVLDQFRAAIDATVSHEPPQWDVSSRKLAEERAHLNGYVASLHQIRAGGFSVFQALGTLGRLSSARVFAVSASGADNSARLEELRQHVERLRAAVIASGSIARSPWQGCTVPSWQVDLPSRIASAIDQTVGALDRVLSLNSTLAAQLGANAAMTVADVESLVSVAATLSASPSHGAVLRDWQRWGEVEPDATRVVALSRSYSAAMQRVRATFRDSVFDLDLDALVARFKKFAKAFFFIAWWSLRADRKLLKTVSRDGVLLPRGEAESELDAARAARDAKAAMTALESRASEIFGPAWTEREADPTALERALAWSAELRRVLASARAGLFGARVAPVEGIDATANQQRAALADLRSSVTTVGSLLGADLTRDMKGADPWAALRGRLTAWRDGLGRLRAWHEYLSSSAALVAGGCGSLVEAVSRGEIDPSSLPDAFERSIHEAWLKRALLDDPVLGGFDGEDQLRHIAKFAELDRSHLANSALAARARVSHRMPQNSSAGTGGEMGILQRQLQKRRGHMSIRKLLGEIPSLAARLKPVFLMSPISVATYLDPRAAPFDLVVFDEASQIPTYQAVGVLARGASAVVVGDTKQLPPTSFFEAGGGENDRDENDFDELESILDECLAAGIPERRLDWHYRSRHESLIAFSNYHYYKNRLNTFPSASVFGAGRGVQLRPVAGVYDKGESRTNKAEAEAVVSDLVGRLLTDGAGDRTYGVVTFSAAQQKLVEDLLDKAQKDYPAIEPFFAKTNAEPVIVKNLENIQGDERDVIIFSICYGPDQTGKSSMNFGPLNRMGGERRLNVAITRAREELVIYSTLKPEHIDLARTNAVGVKHLKTFLDFAQRGPVAIAEALTLQTDDAFDSPFEEQVCERLRARGFEVDTQVGTAGYRIDLGIRHPTEQGRYVLAVECDGAYYHSARSARERDRLRSQVLEGLGWQIHRVWSTDWWQTPERELDKIVAAIERAKVASPPVAPRAPVVEVAAVPARVESGGVFATPSASRPTRRPPAAAAEPMQLACDTSSVPAVQHYAIAPIGTSKFGPEDVHDDANREHVKRVLLGVLAVEAPVSLTVLGRRVAPYFAVARVSSRFEERLRAVLGRSATIKNDVVWRTDQDPDKYIGIRLADVEARREAQEVPLEEVANAAALVLQSNISIVEDELLKLMARILGFQRVGGRVSDHMAAGVALLLKRGGANRDGEKVVLA